MRHPVLLVVFAGLLVLSAGCGKKTETAQQEQPAPTTEAAPGPKAEAPTLSVSELPGTFQTPESVLYDAADDVYLVSNINGDALAKDGNGYISRIDAETHEGTDKWIAGGVNGVTLNAPKGSAIIGGEFWVTDIDTIRKFDLATGAPKGEIPIPGTVFLNDLAAGPNGTAYVTDTGMTAGEKGFEPAGTDAVYEIKADGTPVKIASGDDLGHPNGIRVVDGQIWVNTFGSNELYRIADGKKTDVSTLPTGGLDGLLHLSDGDFVVSSWDGKAIYRGPKGGPFDAFFMGITSPADIGLDTKRNLVLIPVFQESKVLIRTLANTRAE